MNIDKKKLIIQILSIIGFALTIELAVIYYNANYERYSLASFCSISDFIDCDGAARTRVSQVFGIPLAYWGMFLYITVFFLTIVDKLKKIKFLKFMEVFKNPMSYITVIGTFSFIISMVLAGISLWGIKKLCLLCLATYLLDLIIAMIPQNNFKDFLNSFKVTAVDFWDGAKKYPKTLAVLLILTITFLTYSGVTNVFVPHIKKSNEIRKYIKMKTNPYKVNGNVLGNENGEVIIDLYSDFVCPLCYIHNIMLHKAAKEFSNIKIIHHNFPFDKECNVDINVNMHPGACFMARAALAAELQGNYWGMSSLLYEKKPMNEEKLIPLIEELGLDKDKLLHDMNSPEISNKLVSEINHINNDLGLDSTPTTYINGEMHLGIMPYKVLEELLEKHGAKKRK